MTRRRRVSAAALTVVAFLLLVSSPATATPENDLDPENLVSDSLPSRAAPNASEGRAFVTPDDVKPMVKPVLRHRLMLHPDAQLQGITADARIDDIAEATAVPRAA